MKILNLILPQKNGDQVKPQILSYTIPVHSEQELPSHWQADEEPVAIASLYRENV